ncbi:MAG: hypothetical protein ACTHLE_01360 [Agriterribacter sp.]
MGSKKNIPYTLKVSFGVVNTNGAICLSVIDIENNQEVSFKRIKQPALVNEAKFPYLERKAYLINVRNEKTNALLLSFQIEPKNDC